MKIQSIIAGVVALAFAACVNPAAEQVNSGNGSPDQRQPAAAGLQLNLDANPEWTYQNLRLYPILAGAGTQAVPRLTALAQAMQTPGFRITERKQFGRNTDNWYNALTVQNKTRDTVFLMSGDVVTGGNQDRVIAYDDAILPGTLKNIEVFCVESGRSSYYDPNAPASEKQVAAFRGYYNVASPSVRMAVHAGNQQGVWNAVAAVTAENNAHSDTHTYTALETENEQKAKRAGYLQFFDGKFTNLPNAVGLLAVCNGKVVGVDIFGRPDLFQQQFKALLHGYAAEAATAPNTGSSAAEASVSSAFREVADGAQANPEPSKAVGRFSLGGKWIHLYKK